MKIEKDRVLVRTDSENRVTAINSSGFADGDGWIQIDEGYGDKYHHAQNNYLDKSIMDEHGIYRYKLVDGKPVERTVEEMDADYAWRDPRRSQRRTRRKRPCSRRKFRRSATETIFGRLHGRDGRNCVCVIWSFGRC